MTGNPRRILTTGLAAAALAAGALQAQVVEKVIQGRAVTGINRILGQPYFQLPEPHLTVGFYTIGAWNPGGTSPLPLTPTTPPDTLLATAYDPELLQRFSVPPSSVNPALANIPLRDVAVVSDFFGNRAPMIDTRVSAQLAPGRAVSIGDITLNQWMKAGGTATILCGPSFRPRVELVLFGLIPHGLYSAWGGMILPTTLKPIALGGIPNAFVASETGTATFSARLNYCPLALKPGEAPLGFIDVLFHSDNALYGGVGELIDAGFPTGTVTHIAVEFPVTATTLIQ